MEPTARQRVDKWLFFVRVVKSRSLAARLVQAGRVRLNRVKIDHPAQQVKPGDVLTVTLEQRVIVYRVLGPGMRRGPADEARMLYEDLSPPPAPKDAGLPDAQPPLRPRGSGRPTKKERRRTEALRGEGAA